MRVARVLPFLAVLGVLSAPFFIRGTVVANEREAPIFDPPPSATAEPFPMQSAVQPPPSLPASLAPGLSVEPVETSPATKPSTKTTKSTPKTYRLSPVTAYFDQAAIDRCKLVLWMSSPTQLIAGHDSCGYAWLDNVPTGATVIVTSGPAAGTYRVVGHKWQDQKGGPIPSWMADYDLVLQTCTGASGMGFSLAQRV